MLEALEQEATLTQRTLSLRLGIALGLTNLYLKRLVRKGYVKCVTVAPNRLMYMVTPRGVARRVRLTYEFMKYSLDFYRDVRTHLRQTLPSDLGERRRVAIYGTGDAAELVYLLLKDVGAELVAVFDVDDSRQFLGLPVLDIRQHEQVTYDVMVLAVLEKPAKERKRVLGCGVPADKLLVLQPQAAQLAPAERSRHA